MKNIKRFSFLLILIISLSSLLAFSAFAESEKTRFIDGAERLTEEEGEALREKLDKISEKYKQDIIIITENFPDTADTTEYAMKLYNSYDYGYGDNKAGILLFIYRGEEGNSYELATPDYSDNIFDDGNMNSLRALLDDELSEENMYYALDAFIDECEYVLKYEDILPPIWIIIALIVGAIVGGIVIFSMTAKHKNVKMQRSAGNYIIQDSFRLDRSRDIYLYSLVTRVIKPQNNGSSGGTRSSSGGSFNTRSGRF